MAKKRQGIFKTTTGETLLRWFCYAHDGYCRMVWAKSKSEAKKECENRGMKVVKVEPAAGVNQQS